MYIWSRNGKRNFLVKNAYYILIGLYFPKLSFGCSKGLILYFGVFDVLKKMQKSFDILLHIILIDS